MYQDGYKLDKRYEHDDNSIFLSDAEIGKLKIKIGKSHRNEKDWDYIGSTEKRAQCAENRTGAKAIVSADGRHSWL